MKLRWMRYNNERDGREAERAVSRKNAEDAQFAELQVKWRQLRGADLSLNQSRICARSKAPKESGHCPSVQFNLPKLQEDKQTECSKMNRTVPSTKVSSVVSLPSLNLPENSTSSQLKLSCVLRKETCVHQ